ncbi:MAG: hypothetical protein IE878_05410 [Epsilonproteobacteria bacterium]|nr:hypothetical protein [Campylobacterota bacterium]
MDLDKLREKIEADLSAVSKDKLVIIAEFIDFIKQKDTKENKQLNSIKQVTKSSEEISKEISNHNSKEDCWISVNGKTYDVTEYVNNHPGGEAILEGCGKDATELFFTRPMGSGTSHSAQAEELLKSYLVE